jgi:hypothetical protein
MLITKIAENNQITIGEKTWFAELVRTTGIPYQTLLNGWQQIVTTFSDPRDNGTADIVTENVTPVTKQQSPCTKSRMAGNGFQQHVSHKGFRPTRRLLTTIQQC